MMSLETNKDIRRKLLAAKEKVETTVYHMNKFKDALNSDNISYRFKHSLLSKICTLHG